VSKDTPHFVCISLGCVLLFHQMMVLKKKKVEEQSCSVMSNSNGTKFTEEVPFTQGKPHSNCKKKSINHSRHTSNQTFDKNSASSHTFNKNCCNSQTNITIWLKFGTLLGGPKVNLSVRFGANLIKIHSYEQFYE